MKYFNKLLCLSFAVAPLLFSCNPGGGNSDKEPEVIKTYTVTLNANGGSFESNKSTTKKLSNCTVLAKADLEEPVKTDYGFKGWYLNQSATSAVTFPFTLNKNITIYAGWNEMPKAEFTYEKTPSIDVSEPVNNVYTITVNAPTNGEVPTITLSGDLTGAQLLFNVDKAYKGKGDINIVFNNFKIVSTDTLAPISIPKIDNVVNIISKENTSNYVFDKRPATGEFEDDGAINAKSNLKFSGTGSLYVNDKTSYPGYKQAIYCSKNITIEDSYISSYGYDTSIKGKRSITINNASVVAYSRTGSGLKTSDEDVQDGVRCGDISINGSTSLTIAVSQHGISASHDLLINKNDSGSPKISVYTSSKYASSYITISTPSITEKDMYIQMPSSSEFATYANQEEYRFAVLFDTGDWDKATLKKYHATGMRGTPNPGPGGGVEGYYFGLDRPVNAKTYQIYLFDKDHDKDSTTEGEYIAKMTSAATIPSSGDTAKIATLSGSSISCSSTFGTYDSMVEKDGNSEKATYGCKGMTAGNKININSGILNIKSNDDAIHGKYGKLFPYDETSKIKRSVGTGVVTIDNSDTQIYITTTDDAINGTTLNIGDNGSPTINIETCYEGLEAGIINYKNGNSSIYARDDGMNGANVGNILGDKVSLNISGGYLDIQTGGGDTDGIDSNNNYVQTGGVVVSRASSNSTMSTGLDVDGSASVSGSGVFIALGAQPEPAQKGKLSSSSNGNESYTFKQNCTYKVNNTYAFITKLSYSKYYYYIGSSASKPTIS